MNLLKIKLSVLLAVTTTLGTAHAADEHTMTGCLTKGPDSGSFMLTDAEGPVKTVALAGTTVDLGPHLGHKVEITGATVAGADPHAMTVTGMKHLAANCP